MNKLFALSSFLCLIALDSAAVAQQPVIVRSLDRLVRLESKIIIENEGDGAGFLKIQIPDDKDTFSAIFERLYIKPIASKDTKNLKSPAVVTLIDVNRAQRSGVVPRNKELVEVGALAVCSTGTNPWLRTTIASVAGFDSVVDASPLKLLHSYATHSERTPEVTIELEKDASATVAYSGTLDDSIAAPSFKVYPELVLKRLGLDSTPDETDPLTVSVNLIDGVKAELLDAFVQPLPDPVRITASYSSNRSVTLSQTDYHENDIVFGVKLPILESSGSTLNIEKLSIDVSSNYDLNWEVVPYVGGQPVATGRLRANERQIIQVPGIRFR